jgi:hypothetical protein
MMSGGREKEMELRKWQRQFCPIFGKECGIA